jgi:hypothetical protein
MHPDISMFSSDISNTEIVYVKNFLTKEDCKYVLSIVTDIVENQSENEKLIGYSNDGNINSKDAPFVFVNNLPDEKMYSILKDINTRMEWLYQELYGYDQEITYLYLGTINGMGVGKGMAIHVDNVPSLAINVDTPHGMILYINDDYEGGELYYPDLKLAIKPEAGSLVIHPGNAEYVHGVAPVTSGMRYATTAFTKKKLP